MGTVPRVIDIQALQLLFNVRLSPVKAGRRYRCSLCLWTVIRSDRSAWLCEARMLHASRELGPWVDWWFDPDVERNKCDKVLPIYAV